MFFKKYKMTIDLQNHNCYPCKHLNRDYVIQELFIGGKNRKIVLWLPICHINDPYMNIKSKESQEMLNRFMTPKLEEDDEEEIHLELAYNRCFFFDERK